MLKRRKSSKSDKKYWIDKLDHVFSLYIRLRDSKEFGFRKFRCISCGQPKDFDQMDAGHFVGRACMAIRWNEQNVNGECKFCNRMSSSHLLYYRKNLIVKLGTEAISGSQLAMSMPLDKKMALINKLGTQKVEWLEAQKFTQKKWSVSELQEMYMYYAALVLKMKEERL